MARSSGTGGQIDAADFERIFRAYWDQVLRFCLRRTVDPAAAEDLTAAVFLETWRHRDRVDLTTRDALPWLYGVATNMIRNERRSLRRARAAQRRLPLPTSEMDTADVVADRLDASARLRAAVARFEELPAAERDVLVLCVGRNWTYRAAATELRVPIGTVRSRLARARARLSAAERCQCPRPRQ